MFESLEESMENRLLGIKRQLIRTWDCNQSNKANLVMIILIMIFVVPY